MAIYYHISTNLNHDGVFYPRIPSCRHKDQEDNTIGRISIAPTIEDCLTAIPNGGGRLDELNISQRGYYLVFKIDTEKLGIKEEDMVSAKELFEKDLVRDAEATNEVWITTAFTVPESDRFLIKLITWEETAHDLYPFAIQELANKEANKEYEGDFERAYQDVYDDFVPFCTKIIDAEYINESVIEGTVVPLYFETEEEKEELKKLLSRKNDIETVKEFIDELEIVCKKAMSLKDIFLAHRKISCSYN